MTAANHPATAKEISCRITRTLLLYVREKNQGELGSLLEGLSLDEAYLSDINNWVSHEFLQILYRRMIDLLGDEDAVYHMTLASERLHSLGFLERIGRLLGSPKLIYSQAPKYNDFFRLNGSLFIHDIGKSWVILEDRYHDNCQKTRYDCDYTRGFLAGIPTIFGMPLAEVTEIECQVRPEKYGQRLWPDEPHQGGDGCIYRVRWNAKGTPFFKRFFFRRQTQRQAVEDLVQANRLIQSKYDEVTRLLRDLEGKNKELHASKRQLEAQKSALMTSERKHRMLAEHVSDTIWVLNLDTLTFDYVSPSVRRNFGFTPQEISGMSLEDILSPDSLAMVLKLIEEETANELDHQADPHRALTLEVEQKVKNGNHVWVEATVSFIRNANGEATSVMGVTRDVSERRKAEQKIAESEKKYRTLFENGSDLICIHDLEGNLLETNLPYKKEYGWGQADLEGTNIGDLIPQRYQEDFHAYLERIKSRGADEGYFRGFSSDGREVILEYRNRLIRDHNGNPQAVQGAARDVTERIRYEKALKEREAQYREIVTHAPAAILEIDIPSGALLSVNEVMTAYTDFSETELLNMDLFALLGPTDQAKVRSRFAEANHGQGDSQPDEYTVRGKDGKTLPVVANFRFFFEHGTPNKAMTILHDMTAIKAAEDEKRKLEHRLQQAKKYESLGTLAGGVAHDLNNILSSIVGYPDLILRHVDQDSPLRRPLEAIQRSGEKAAQIVQDLLTLARRNVPEKTAINLNDVVTSLVEAPEYRRLFAGKAVVQIDVTLDPNLLNILGSEGHAFKTIMNLMTNAADAIPKAGKITISTENRYLDTSYTGFEVIPDGEYVVLQVSDTGIGMAQKDLEKIFEPFYTKKVLGRSGTGLGMSVVWGTVKDHDGYIDITTEEGAGTTFSLYFPASRAEIELPDAVEVEDYLGHGESILIVDDAPEQRELTQHMVEHLGYVAHTADSGEKALDMVRGGNFDLLVLDMIMPAGMDGLDTFKAIRRIAPDQKAIIASGYAETDRVRVTRELGAGAYIKKPFTLDALGLAIRRELDDDRSAGENAT